GGADGDCQGVGDGVVDGDEFALEGAELFNLALFDGQGVRTDPVFLQLGLDQGKRQLRTHQRDVGTEPQEVGNSADMVLVSVGQDHSRDIVQPVLDVGEIGQDQVDARLGLLREEDTAVDDEQLPVDLEDGHVPADLPQPAKRDNAKGA